MNADTLVMQPRDAIATRHEEPGGGAIKSILFAVHQDDGLEDRFQTALSIARACSAHLRLVHVVPIEAYTAIDSYGGAFVSGEIVEELEKQADELRKQLEGHLRKEDVSWTYEIKRATQLGQMIQDSALADLLIMGREPHWREFNHTGPSLLGALICSIRTPICIPGDGCKMFDPFGKALIAWNGSVESANAVRASIGLLKMAADVCVIRFIEDEGLQAEDAELLEYLSRHGVHAQIESHLPKFGILEDLVGKASNSKAAYIVMGGYSHSRAGEFLFGGLTRDVLRACPISLVMGH